MRALVVYESSFGNTGQVAQAVWQGMFSRMHDVALLEVGAAPRRLPPELELLVVGAPTQAFGMSRPGTRADAQQKAGETEAAPTIGVREWLRELEPPERPVHAATFDTRIHSPHVPGSAAVGAWRVLRRAGFQVAAEAESFWVMGIKGPLRDGELDRARAWGVGLTGLLLGLRPIDPGSLGAPAR
ncbi:flavodoxin/nitric oxide synthase [Cellulomonas sp. ICMP 17802]|uniref:flavodoxin/nitric oxide synthase n=1 Tax=Cellulomonas sp. ICMP 17802 TaxID=3239199 RepID=UPI00351B247C